MKNKFLEQQAVGEMKAKGQYSKLTFKMLLEDAGIKQSELLNYIREQPENQSYLDLYVSSYLSDMLSEKSIRKPTKDVSIYLKKLLAEKGILANNDDFMMPGRFLLELREELIEKEIKEIKDKFGESEIADKLIKECKQDYEWYDQENYEQELITTERKNYIDGLLSDTMLFILDKNFDLFVQFNPYLWDTIKKLEQCTVEQRLKIKYEFKSKQSRKLLKESRMLKEKNEQESKEKKEESEKLLEESVKLKEKSRSLKGTNEKESELLEKESEDKKEKSQKLKKESEELLENNLEIRDFLNFSWDCTLENREQALNKIVELWAQYDVPLWDSLEVFGKMSKEVWDITTMIVLSNWYPHPGDFSPKKREKLDKLFSEN